MALGGKTAAQPRREPEPGKGGGKIMFAYCLNVGKGQQGVSGMLCFFDMSCAAGAGLIPKLIL